MHRSQFSRPGRSLEQSIRFYIQREARIDGPTVVHPIPARPTPMIVFDFDDPTDVFLYQKQAVVKSPLTVVVGPQTYRRLEMRLYGALDTFVIVFQPDGMHRLFSIPMHELTNLDFEAHSVLGSFITSLGERLSNSRSFTDRVRIVEEALLPLAVASTGFDGISAAANGIIIAGGRVGISALALSAGLSMRQFERRFTQQVGMRPKLFARIARFEAALENKARFDNKSWTEVAHEYGYYDQMHMIHDFAEFTGGTPAEILTQLQRVFVEQIRTMRSHCSSNVIDSNSRLIL
jgi:AraC-like DNA-binding protein